MLVYFDQLDPTTYIASEKILKDNNQYVKYYLDVEDIQKIKRFIRKNISKRVIFIKGKFKREYALALKIKFKDNADEAFFLLHSSDGIEIT